MGSSNLTDKAYFLIEHMVMVSHEDEDTVQDYQGNHWKIKDSTDLLNLKKKFVNFLKDMSKQISGSGFDLLFYALQEIKNSQNDSHYPHFKFTLEQLHSQFLEFTQADLAGDFIRLGYLLRMFRPTMSDDCISEFMFDADIFFYIGLTINEEGMTRVPEREPKSIFGDESIDIGI